MKTHKTSMFAHAIVGEKAMRPRQYIARKFLVVFRVVFTRYPLFSDAFLQIVIAMAVSTWYFTRDKKANIGTGTVCGAVSTSLLYHSGTAAFGSLIIATIKTIRAVVTYVQKKAKDSSNKLAEVSRSF